jgi:hypothetical protein
MRHCNGVNITRNRLHFFRALRFAANQSRRLKFFHLLADFPHLRADRALAV